MRCSVLSPRALFCGLAALAGCTHLGRSATDPLTTARAGALVACQARTPASAAPFESSDSAAVQRLVGEYALVIVTDSGPRPGQRTLATVGLQQTDSAALTYRPVINPQQVFRQPLTAVIRWATDDTGGPSHQSVMRLRRETLVPTSFLNCMDCGLSVYRISWWTADAFGGVWNAQWPFRVLGEDGREYAGTNGRFCAHRHRPSEILPPDA
jgi:hypothetical protein